MVSFARLPLMLLLVVLIATLTSIGANSDFSVSSTSTESVDSSTEHVSYVRQWTLTSTNTHNNGNDNDDDDSDDDSSDDGDDKIDSIKLQLPGRVFISYTSNLPSGVLGYVNVSGDSQSVVESVKVNSNDDDEELEVKYTSSSSSTGYLLTEIFLATSNIVDDIESTAEVVIEDGVVIASNTNKELQIKASDSSIVYVSSSTMSLQDLKLELSDSATLQLTTDSITIREDGQFKAHSKSSITVLTSSLIVDDLDLDAENSGTICISATEVTASSYDGEERSKISLPNASSKYTSTAPAPRPLPHFDQYAEYDLNFQYIDYNKRHNCVFLCWGQDVRADQCVPMDAWSQPPRSPNSNNGRFESDTADFQSLGAFGHDSFLSGNGQLSSGLELGGLGLGLGPPPPPRSGSSRGLNLGLNLQQQPPLPMAPPLPPSSPRLTEGGGALYHLQHQQQLHQQQERGFDLSDAMLNLDLGGGMLGNERRVLGGSAGWGDNSSSLSSASPSSASLRDQMNAQMAALYQHPKPTNDRLLFQHPQHQRQPLAQSGSDLLSLLNNGNHSDLGGRELYPPPNVSISGGSMQSPVLGGFSGFPASSPNNNGGHGGLAPTMSPSRGPHSRSSTPSRTRRSPAKSPQLHRDNSAPNSLGGGQGNSIHVSPEVTKPNDNIKVQVSLLAEECVVGRVLLVGLFRLGQPTNDKPIFVKQVLFENKLHRNYRFLNTRITFRAPRSPGEFEFRVFEDKSGHSHQPNGKRQGHSNDDHHDSHHHGKVSYSNVTIARSNRLKVCLEYSHFIDTLRATHDKFQQGVSDGDAGLVLSALLALMRLVDQVETVFLHGHALLGDLLEACLRLLERHAEDIARSFAATETIPHPMETFHGTLRN
ncbi:Hypothetical protein PHPALM_15434, partial [Phytophthora palmivora]